MTSAEDPDRIRELIHRRRRQVIVHSILYYRLDSPVVSDATFDAWGKELAALQDKYPALADEVSYLKDAFRGFTGSTGFDLPLDDPVANATARQLLERAHRAAPGS